MNLLKKIVGSRNDRLLNQYQKILKEINLLSEEVKKIDNNDFPTITEDLKNEYKNGKSLDEILPKCLRSSKRGVFKNNGYDTF